MRIAIVGTSGRGDNNETENMTSELYAKMLEIAEQYLLKAQELDDAVSLISGGAAWSDHLAVSLHLKYKVPLILHLPCKFTDKFVPGDNSSKQWGTAKTANELHQKFSAVVGFDSLAQLEQVQKTAIKYGQGFLARNTQIVENADWLLAFSWSTSDKKITGGTGDTWRKFIASKGSEYAVHVSLSNLV